jgi:hypothetical protein
MIDQLTNMLQVYKQQIENDFQSEWSKKHLKWFFKKRRQKKLLNKIFRRYQMGIFSVTQDWIQDEVKNIIEESIDNFVNIKDVTIGDKAYFTEETKNV